MLRNHGIEHEPDRFVGRETRERGRIKPWLREQQLLGFNYRMTDIQAALGISQLAKLGRFLERRRAIARHYDEAFAGLPAISLPQSTAEERLRSAHHLYIALFDFDWRCVRRLLPDSAFMAHLAECGVGSQVHYMPVYHHPFHARRVADQNAFPQAERYYRDCLSLPLHPGLTDEEVERVIGAVSELVTGA